MKRLLGAVAAVWLLVVAANVAFWSLVIYVLVLVARHYS
ncbi:hypothetical protein FHR57_001128 [Xanthomonas arboricola]|nr:hypothetical protein [Xanthomonas arboricola]